MVNIFEVSTTVNVEITPERLAIFFTEMSAEEQARFFNHLAIRLTFWKNEFVLQLQHISDCEILTNEAREVMRKIGEYSTKVN